MLKPLLGQVFTTQVMKPTYLHYAVSACVFEELQHSQRDAQGHTKKNILFVCQV